MHDATPLVDEAAISDAKKLLGDKFSQLLEFYLEDTASYIAAIHQARLERQDEVISAIAHKIKSSSLQLGAIRLSDIAKDIEHHGGTCSLDELKEKCALLESIFKATETVLRGIIY